MKAIICIDDNNGMLFNKRRLSKDKALNDWIIRYIKKNNLWIRPYSVELFENYDKIRIAEDYLDKAGKNDYCFIEDKNYVNYTSQMDTILLCKWNRRYPSDTKFNISLLDEPWSMEKIAEFKGNSHEKITIEKYVLEDCASL